ncbi:MAG: hypothetical protein DDT22_00889 [candidate division WS2 bacterium]|nr:hypothetical protein [Candidatus Lithacetigena glycinireducens]
MTNNSNQNIYKDILESVADDIMKSVKIKVLIFGPGPSGGDVHKKRCEIKEEIINKGHTAHFGEDICKKEILQTSGLNLSVAEYITSMKYDYIICLMNSPGSIGEVHDFARDKRIATKMMICINGKHKSGYSAEGVIRIFEGLHGKVDWFKSPRDIKDCYLLTRVIEQIMKVAEARQWEIATGSLLS